MIVVNLKTNAQTFLDDSKQKIINKITNDSTYRNIVITDSIVEYDVYIDDELYSHDIKYFTNDTCFKYKSIVEVIYYNLELQVFHDLYGTPIISNNWAYKSNNNYRLANIEIVDDKVVSTITSYNNYNEYLNTLHLILNPTEYD